MNITVTVMAHPKRRAAAEKLALELKRYPFMDVSITWDQNNDEWTTGSRSLRRGIGRGDWHIVVQDDAIITPDFYANIEGCIRAVPIKSLISLYTGTVKPLPERVKAAVDKAYYSSFIKHDILMWGVGILLPSDHIEPMLEYIEDRSELYDFRIGIFYQRNMLPIYYTMPSLVDHDDDLGSIIGTDAKEPRRAHKVATGAVVWNDEVIDL